MRCCGGFAGLVYPASCSVYADSTGIMTFQSVRHLVEFKTYDYFPRK